MSDFNEFNSANVKEGGKPFLLIKSYLKDFLENCGGVYLGTFCPWLTWKNKQSKRTRIRKRLDRVITSAVWLIQHPKAAIIINKSLQFQILAQLSFIL